MTDFVFGEAIHLTEAANALRRDGGTRKMFFVARAKHDHRLIYFAIEGRCSLESYFEGVVLKGPLEER